MSNTAQCGKCGAVHDGDDCPYCTYGDTADFRAFRRKVLLVLIRDTDNRGTIKDLWDVADRIARAEPKE